MSTQDSGLDHQAGMHNGGDRMETGLRRGIRAFFDVDGSRYVAASDGSVR